MSSKFFDKATREWVQIRKKLYLQIKADVHKLLAETWKEFLPLERKYAKELNQSWRAISKAELYLGVSSASFILMGDFHALQQSQRAHLRILRDWPQNDFPVLAVEFFQARHQKYVDAYWHGKISEKAFLENISWAKTWGFPWEHYKPIVDWAIKNKVPLFGINWGLRQTKIKSIKTRENFSAISLRKIHRRFPHRKIVIIYGDLHLSSGQLPAAIKKNIGIPAKKIKRVFQNDEELYFHALSRGLENRLEYLQLRSGDFCVQSVPPWVKWQSYLLFLENTYDRQIDDWEGDIDHTDHVAKLVVFLGSEFKLKLKDLYPAIYTAEDTQLYSRIRDHLKKTEWLVVRGWISQQKSFFIPHLQAGYLGRVTVNHTAALAGELVHAFLSKRGSLYVAGDKDFERQIWIQAIAYFGSKIINHKRKTNTLEDLRKSLVGSDSKGKNRKILILAINQKVREVSYFTHGGLLGLKKGEYDDFTFTEAAKLLGAMLGEKLYLLYRSKKWSRSEVVKMMKMPLDGARFQKYYYGIVKKMSLTQS